MVMSRTSSEEKHQLTLCAQWLWNQYPISFLKSVKSPLNFPIRCTIYEPIILDISCVYLIFKLKHILRNFHLIIRVKEVQQKHISNLRTHIINYNIHKLPALLLLSSTDTDR